MLRVVPQTAALFPDLYLFLIFVDRDEYNLSLCDLYDDSGCAKTFGFDDDMDRYRCISDLFRFGVKAHQVTDKDWLVKDDLFHRNRDKAVVPRVPNRLDAPGDVDIA